MTYVVGAIAVALAVVAFFILSWWGGAIVLVLGLAFALYIAAARKENPNVGTIQQARREPTGVPRAASADAETANERVEN
jgi:hypothetical protein